MMNSPEEVPYIFGDEEAARGQFRSTQIQCFNWGTFTGVLTVPISPKGFLIVGPSGSGKSTILDAHATLITPPRYLDFNVAARESEPGSRDRTLLSYVRGAYGQSSNPEEKVVVQYLRKGTTWSALAEIFRNGNGKVVVLAQVLWVRGASTANTDVKRLYMVFEREFDVRDLASFAESDFDVRKLKAKFERDFVREEFSGYEDRFCHPFNIENQRALRLLHKTQSAKSLGDLTSFLRDFMLDPPETFKIAEALCSQFTELNEAHQAVLTAGDQIATLRPARVDYAVREAKAREANVLKEVAIGIDPFKEQEKKTLLEESLAEILTNIKGAIESERLRNQALDDEEGKLRELEERRRGAGGGALEKLIQDKAALEEEKPRRLSKRDKASAACNVLGWTLPAEPTGFAALTEQAQALVEDAAVSQQSQKEKETTLLLQQAEVKQKFDQYKAEIAVMERQPSNIPGDYLGAREDLARGLGIAPEKLPFAGELLQVRGAESEWQGSIERVLGGFGLNILVEDRYYADFAQLLNETNTGLHIFYNRVQPLANGVRPSQQGPQLHGKSLVRKMEIANHSLGDWLKGELRSRFDYLCVDTPAEFRAAERALTIQGQVKHSRVRHEKNDRFRINDRRRWVLGFDNSAKLDLYRKEGHELAMKLEALRAQIAELNEQDRNHLNRALSAQVLQNTTWQDIDVGALLTRIADLEQRIEAEKAARPDLARIDQEIEDQKKAVGSARTKRDGISADLVVHRRSEANTRRELSTLREENLAFPLSPTQREGLQARIGAAGKLLSLSNLSDVLLNVSRAIERELREAETEIQRLGNNIERQFEEFVRKWEIDVQGLDAKLASAPDFFNKLTKLELDDLPRFESRFREMLRHQSDQTLANLLNRLGDERTDMLNRLDMVNESLKTVAFNKDGSCLQIDASDKLNQEVRDFRRSVTESLSQTFDDTDLAQMEIRFMVLKGLVRRLSSREVVDNNWRLLVLDVRQHYEFIAREMNQDGEEIEVYAGSSGKSGGQRQKLTATCLAAALRYQLSGQARGLPMFSTIYLDEAFDKADPAFTHLAMTIFTNFGFQMIVATPMKSVMTLEPFIGGACFVECPDRKHSRVYLIEYDEEKGALNLDSHSHAAKELAVS